MLPAPEWRPHALDGALLWFHRETGTHLRVDGPATRHLRRRAPRLVLFGITNACNLTCGFCSRDLQARSDWTVESAFEVLSGLARAGTLEVAFGGGEPLAFRGFDTLVQRLATETPLAVHVTTNGTLLSEERLARLSSYLGEVRVSLYDDNAWEETVRRLALSGQTFGVNVLATPERLDALPGMLRTLHGLGCRDVAVLRYVGNDPRLQLRAADEARLTALLADSPVRTRLSVCFGDALVEVPRLFGGDCGAGLDFVTLTSDRKLKACSFQGTGLPIDSAEAVLAGWARRQDVLSTASPLQGCARTGGAREASLPDGLRVWRGFSGNNSGDCVLVGRFETTREATDFVDALVPPKPSDRGYPESWKALLAAEGIQVDPELYPPELMASGGRTVMFHTDSTLKDDFAPLRKWLWKRGGRTVLSDFFGNEPLFLATGFGASTEAALGALEVTLASESLGAFVRQGRALFGLVPFEYTQEDLTALMERLQSLALKQGAVVAAELVRASGEEQLPLHLGNRDAWLGPERLLIHFASSADAARVARNLNGVFCVAGTEVLVEADHMGSRLQRLFGLRVTPLTGRHVIVEATYRGTKLQSPELTSRLRPYLKPEDRLTASDSSWGIRLRVRTSEPLRVLPALVELGPLVGAEVRVQMHDEDRLAAALHRVRVELESELRGR